MKDPNLFTTANIDRLLGLADQFLDDWAEDAVQSGKPDADYEERTAEWAFIRPLLLLTPELLKGLTEIAHCSHSSTEPDAVRYGAIAQASIDLFSAPDRPVAG
jgi:hypothetical protein